VAALFKSATMIAASNVGETNEHKVEPFATFFSHLSSDRPNDRLSNDSAKL
jgi:hypothetical protein